MYINDKKVEEYIIEEENLLYLKYISYKFPSFGRI